MRITFLCGSLELGKDGVGDYTRLLATELTQQGHKCLLIALNDRWRTGGPSATREESGLGVREVRLASSLSWAERMARVREELAEFQTDVISLQFVPYAFNKKGIVLGLDGLLSGVISDVRPRPVVHVLFHELWIGGSPEAPLKDKLIGFIQKSAVGRLVRKIQPDVVHTTNEAYRAGLNSLKIKAKLLPLFGNIPIAEASVEGNASLLSLLQKAEVPINSANRGNFWICGMFGTIHPEWSPEPVLPLLKEVAKEAGRSIVFLSVGRMGRGEPVWQKMVGAYSDLPVKANAEASPGSVFFAALGEQTEDQISRCLSMMDFGLTTTPQGLLGKSGTVAAMWDHGLPVVVTRLEMPFQTTTSADVNAAEEAEAESSLQYILRDPDIFRETIRQGWTRRPPASRLPNVVRRFTSDLDAARCTHSQVVLKQGAGIPL